MLGVGAVLTQCSPATAVAARIALAVSLGLLTVTG